MQSRTVALLALLSLAASQTCSYGNKQTWQGSSFFDAFNFFDSSLPTINGYQGTDPTHGFVNYVPKSKAKSQGYINVNSKNQTYIGVNYKDQQWGGRDSIRITSRNRFSLGLLVLDLEHAPGSVCGSWPAFWTVGAQTNWPGNGEIDILEGVNNQDRNVMTLHTQPGCNVWAGQSGATGSLRNGDCGKGGGYEGCGFGSAKTNSYGDGFNRAGGGAYAMERNTQYIKIWHFARGQYPSDLLSGNPNPCNWGTPDALFPLGPQCPTWMFAPQEIIFNIDFCGDWAGNVFGNCAGNGQDCKTYVATNPEVFKDSFFLINSLSLYSPEGSGPTNPPTTTPTPTTQPSGFCAQMFANLQCRTKSEDPNVVGQGALEGARGWLCSGDRDAKYCSEIHDGGKFASCNPAEKLSYAMDKYYQDMKSSQGDGACVFGGIGVVVRQ